MTTDNTYMTTVVFADVAGSSRLYQQLGNREAIRRISKLLERMAEIVDQSDGIVIKTIGDEIMVHFPDAGDALQLAALAHDIDRAIEEVKVRREDFDDYDVFKATHARHGAQLMRPILNSCSVARGIVDEACRLVEVHEVGGDPQADLLKDADSISYFDVNLPLYFQREGWDETKRRSHWGYRRLTPRAKEIVKQIDHKDEELTRLVREVIQDSVR